MLSRPPWEETWLNVAEVLSRRSHDQNTKVGCVIVDKKNHPVSCGYNGFMQGVDDEKLPCEGKDKYFYMIHSEVNAILHATKSMEGCTAYLTHHPCISCLQFMREVGIRKIVYNAKNPPPRMLAEQKDNIDYLLKEVIPEMEIIGWI